MAHFLFRIGKRLMISKRNRNVRGWIIFLFTHFLLLAGIVFSIEIILILLGVGDIFIPFSGKIFKLLSGLAS